MTRFNSASVSIWMKKKLIFLLVIFLFIFSGTNFTFGQEFQNIEGESLSSIIKKADSGQSYYQGLLSRLYRNGLLVKTNYIESFNRAKQAAEGKDISGYYNLSRWYSFGNGVKKDSVLAKQYLTKFISGYKELTKHDRPEYEILMANIYFYDSTFVTRDINKALNHTYKALKIGSTLAYFTLGVFYSNIPNQIDSSIFCYEKFFSLTKSPNAINNLGVIYMDTKKDSLMAHHLYIQASNSGNTDASHNLYNIEFSKKKYQDAFKFLTIAAEQGEPEYQIELAEFYENGNYLPRDYEKAKFWYGKAVEQNVDEAQYKLAWLHFMTDKLPMQKNTIALELLKKSAENGNKNAMQMQKALGLLHL